MKISLARALAEAPELRKAASPSSQDTALSPVQFMGGYGGYGGGQPLQTDWDERRAFQEGYQGTAFPFMCIDRLMGAAASASWKVYETRGRRRREWEVQDGHPYQRTIEFPSEYISQQQMIAHSVLSICCGGNALWRTIYTGKRADLMPAELEPMSTALWRPVPVMEYGQPKMVETREGTVERARWIEGYRRVDRPNLPLVEHWRVVHAQKVDASLIWGGSPMRPLAPIINMVRAMTAWNERLPNNMMVPAGAFTDPTLKTSKQVEEKARWLAARFSSPESSRQPLVMGPGSTWQPMALTPVECDWDASLEKAMLQVCGVFNVSPTLFITDAKYANLEQGMAHLLEFGGADMLKILEDAFNRAWVPFKRRGEIYIAYDLSGVPGAKDTLPQRLEAAERARNMGIPVNSVVVGMDLPFEAVEGGDEPLVPGTLVPLEQLLAADTADPLSEPDDPTAEDPAPPPADPGKPPASESPEPAN